MFYIELMFCKNTLKDESIIISFLDLLNITFII